MIDKKTQGKKNRQSGAEFERRVFKDLWDRGFIATKWNNTISPEGVVTQSKMGRFRIGTSGFPDFCVYEVITKDFVGIECKVNGYLSAKEKEMCRLYLERKIFSKIYIASKIKEKNKIKIVYKEFTP